MCSHLHLSISFSTLFYAINIIISVLLLIAYFEIFPHALPIQISYRSSAPITIESSNISRLASRDYETISFKDIELKFRILHQPQAFKKECQGNLTLLIIVQSAPGSGKIRRVIRDTWASKKNVKSIKDGTASVLFLMGNGDMNSRMITKEINLHKDVISVDAEDSYRNLVFKTVLSLHISKTRCPSTFLLKVDEDVVFNIDRFVKQVQVGAHFYPERREIYCKRWQSVEPRRDAKDAWFISEHQFRGRRIPAYCAGPSYVLTAPAVEALLQRIPDFNLITVEDVFITGIIAAKADVTRVNMDRFHPDYNEMTNDTKICPGQMLSIHNLKTEQDIRETWKFLSKNC